jgi:hypothetical protein
MERALKLLVSLLLIPGVAYGVTDQAISGAVTGLGTAIGVGGIASFFMKRFVAQVDSRFEFVLAQGDKKHYEQLNHIERTIAEVDRKWAISHKSLEILVEKVATIDKTLAIQEQRLLDARVAASHIDDMKAQLITYQNKVEAAFRELDFIKQRLEEKVCKT